MKAVLRRRPSASLVVAVIALVVAASGTAVAASHLVSGDKLIKKHSLSGNRLKNHTITGKQVNLKKLGTVPSATSASTATSAGNASELGGQSAANFLTAANRIGTNGIAKASGSSGGNTVTLFANGPFTVTMTCTKTGSGTSLTLDAKSSEANSVIDGSEISGANTTVDLGSGFDIGPTTSFAEADDVNMDLEAPSGAEMLMLGAQGVNSLGTDCWANWAGIH